MNEIAPSPGSGNTVAPPDLPLSITYFERNTKPLGKRRTVEWIPLCEWIEQNAPTAATKNELPLIKLATFVGDHRKNETLETVYGVEGDYDAGTMRPDEAAALLATFGIRALIYTSPRHCPDKPRWRVLCPLSRPHAPNERHALVGRLNGPLGGILAPESFTPSQAFYVGSVTGGHPLQCWRTEGRPLDTVEGLPIIAPTVAKTGERKPLGTDKAESFAHTTKALFSIDPPDDRDEWRNLTCAFRQAATGLGVDDDMVRMTWDGWCALWPKNNKADNEKLWRSINDGTLLGWTYLRSKAAPAIQAELFFGDRKPLEGEIITKDIFDEPLFGKLAGSTVSTELVAHIKDNGLPIAFDLFKQRQVKRSAMPWDNRKVIYPAPWTDDDDIYLQAWFHRYELKPPMENVKYAVRLAARRNEFNPVTDYLDRLQWDGTKRIDDLFTRYFGAANSSFARMVGAKFLIGMVARAFQPGCKRDEVIVLEGEQGTRKSTALSIIAGEEYFSDSLPNLHDKEAAQHLQGLWIVEIAELAAMRRSEIEDTKRFITTRIDKFRPPYGRYEIESPRTAIFAATTNDDAYLKDTTGARRFWPIKCGIIDTDGLRRDRDQLFAEAVVRYRTGERYWLDGEERTLAAVETGERQELDPWHDAVGRHCAAMGDWPVMMENIVKLLGLPYERQNAAVTKRIAGILRTLGYKQRRNASQRSYVKLPARR